MTKIMLLRICILSFFLLTSCSPNPLQEGTAAPTPTGPSAVQPTQGGSTPMSTPLGTPANSSLDTLIEKVKEDLAGRLSITTMQINLVEATEVEWNDSSLGCPQPGMEYLQVITPGYLIKLETSGNLYEYHSNRDSYFIFCAEPNLPITPPN